MTRDRWIVDTGYQVTITVTGLECLVGILSWQQVYLLCLLYYAPGPLSSQLASSQLRWSNVAIGHQHPDTPAKAMAPERLDEPGPP